MKLTLRDGHSVLIAVIERMDAEEVMDKDRYSNQWFDFIIADDPVISIFKKVVRELMGDSQMPEFSSP